MELDAHRLAATSATAKQIQVMLVDDHISVLEGYAALISRQPDIQLAGMFTSGVEAINQFAALRPDVVLMDIFMPGLNGLDTTRQLVTQNGDCRVIILSSSSDPAAIADAFVAGAHGYLLKGMAFRSIIAAIYQVVSGESVIDPAIQSTVIQEFQRLHKAADNIRHNLTPHEQRILSLLAEGKSTKDIAALFDKAEKTISNQITVIYQKLGVTNRAEAIGYSSRLGLV